MLHEEIVHMKILVQNILILAAVAMVNTSCADSNSNHSERSYPYRAGAERQSLLLSNWPKVDVDMTASEVRALLGEPDEVNPTYNSIHAKSAKKIGYSFVYLLQRLQKNGSVLEKNEKLIRVHFGLNDKVTRVIPVGLRPTSSASSGIEAEKLGSDGDVGTQ